MIFVALLVGSGLYAYMFFLADTEPSISSSPGSTRIYTAPTEPVKRFDEPAFTFELPTDWKKSERENVVFTNHRYQSTKENTANRFLTIYIDNVPLGKAVNKVVAIKANGSMLTHGEVSDHCSDFPEYKQAGQKLSIPMKRDGVDFLCDGDAWTRNVAGTSSVESVNSVRLNGTKNGERTLFFTYEDNGNMPNYDIFYDFLKSFSVK